ncbi:interleukin-22 [Rhinatrema bivittatum]|uniref:interleukin-22 n=1 Tax=Rhinatrema bivittatum TaxID=194408 RepID=UPI00112B9B92|nr:interleukin-22 [Rhinatrema bivittatum]
MDSQHEENILVVTDHFTSPAPLKKESAAAGHYPSCSLRKVHFYQPHMRNHSPFSLSSQASSSDQDTVNRLIGSQLFLHVTAEDHCYLMKKVLNFTLEEVLLPEIKSPYLHIQDVTNFLANMRNELNACKPTEHKQQIENNLEELTKKMKELGESGRNKAIGELDLLFDRLESACSQQKRKLPQVKPAE